MICQRSGQCCVTMTVIIPGPSKDGLRALVKPAGRLCPYLSFSSQRRASCAIHDLPFYEGSPCWIYGNPDVDPDFGVKRGRACAVGKLLIKKKKQTMSEPCPLTLGQLEDLGPWPDEDSTT